MSELEEKIISEFNNYSISKSHLENSFIIEEKRFTNQNRILLKRY